ncbi:hypothetical protein MUN88_09555 [Gracilibacillus caseinilyticus]|uniref:Peptidase M14 domain-containing protein n=1 Tax=Gracilibacillus caseinilyticus TaxID=2932256 RepID=A0ABY4F0S9_9BACI|nr:M14 family zinc carboxypeptidase [Gracilibacillus caseinilyticus]UOQ50275.1 hypothetical protein MUN88_09555 [Gracilibacillus caseinilyticus]
MKFLKIMSIFMMISTIILAQFSSISVFAENKSTMVELKEPVQFMINESSYVKVEKGALLSLNEKQQLVFDERTYDLQSIKFETIIDSEKEPINLSDVKPVTEADPKISIVKPQTKEDTSSNEESTETGPPQLNTDETDDREKPQPNEDEEEKTPQEESDKSNSSDEDTEKESNNKEDTDKETESDSSKVEDTEDKEVNVKAISAKLTFSNTKLFETNQDNVSLYKKENGELIKVSTLIQGEIYQYYQDVGNWLRVKIGSKIYYLWQEATDPVDPDTSLHNPAAISGNQTLTTITEGTIYDNSRNGLVDIGTYEADESFTYVRKSGNWYKINYLGRYAYIYHSAVIESNINQLDYIIPKQDVPVNLPGKIPFASLEEGQLYQTIDEEPNWIKVKIGNLTGYVWKAAVWKTSEKPLKTTSATGQLKLKTTEDVPVFDNSTGKLIQIGEIDEAKEIRYISRKGNWYQINFANRTGFIYYAGVEALFTKNTKYFTTDQDNVSAMIRRNGSLQFYGELQEGESYERLADYGNWHQIKIGDQHAFVWKKATSPASAGDIPNPISDTSVQAIYQTKETVSVYDNSSGSLEAMGTITSGEKIPVLNTKGNWATVNYAGREGYIYKPSLKLLTKDVVNPQTTYTYEQMQKDLNEIVDLYPDHTQKTIIGNSVDGRNLYAIKVGNGDKEIFINGSHHAREHMTTNVVMEMIDQYARAYAVNGTFNGYKVKEILDEVSIWFVPMVNPDGVTLVQKGYTSAKNPNQVLRLNNYSKDFSSWKANIRGIDLNRQYPARWKYIQNAASSPGPAFYKGAAPLTEPEVMALYDFTNERDFKTTVAYHSSGQIIYWYFNNPFSTKARDKALAQKVSNITGYSLVAATTNPSGGGYKDWVIQEHQTPSLTIEISPYTYQEPVPLYRWGSIWNKNKTVGIYLAQEAGNR